jgi:hypothetical protein
MVSVYLLAVLPYYYFTGKLRKLKFFHQSVSFEGITRGVGRLTITIAVCAATACWNYVVHRTLVERHYLPANSADAIVAQPEDIPVYVLHVHTTDFDLRPRHARPLTFNHRDSADLL